MNRYRGLQGISLGSAISGLLAAIGISWFIAFYVIGWQDKAAGRDATPNFFCSYLLTFLWVGLPARWWRYTVGFPRTLMHGLVWAYLVYLTIGIVTVLASFAGAHDLAETVLLLLAPYYLPINIAMWWQQRTPATRHA